MWSVGPDIYFAVPPYTRLLVEALVALEGIGGIRVARGTGAARFGPGTRVPGSLTGQLQLNGSQY